MGYYVRLTNVDFTIPAEHLDAAYAAVCALNTTHHKEKRGGSWSGGKETEKWFSWMDPNYPDVCKDLVEVMEMLGFDCGIEDDGSFHIYSYDSKAGQEDLFLETLAPYVKDGSFLYWMGEDGEQWGNLYKDGKFHHAQAHITFSVVP